MHVVTSIIQKYSTIIHAVLLMLKISLPGHSDHYTIVPKMYLYDTRFLELSVRFLILSLHGFLSSRAGVTWSQVLTQFICKITYLCVRLKFSGGGAGAGRSGPPSKPPPLQTTFAFTHPLF